MPATAACLTALAFACPAPQDVRPADADPVVARFELEGRPAAILRHEIAAEAAQRHRRDVHGEEALKLLIDRYLVDVESRQQGLAPSRREIAERVDTYRQALAQQERTLEDWLQAKRTTWEQFERDFVALSIAHERLVMRELDLTDPSQVTPQHLELWLREARGRHRIEIDPAQLPDGIVATVDDKRFDLADLGNLLLPNISDEDREGFIRRIVLRRLIAAEARAHDIEVDLDDARAEVERRRAEVESDPRYQGVSYDEWLKSTQGMTPEELARSQHMIATVQRDRIVEALHPDAELRRRLEQERDEVLARHGEKREIGLLLLRARDEPNEIVTRDFDAATAEANRLLGELQKGKTFESLASIHSEDPYTKARKGRMSPFPRGQEGIPEPIREAAFGLRRLEVSEPIRIENGVVLIKLIDIEPAPPEAKLLEQLRLEVGQEYLEGLLEKSRLEIL